MWEKGCCRNDCGFWLDPGGVVLGTAPLIHFSEVKKVVSPLQKPFGLSQDLNLLPLWTGAIPYYDLSACDLAGE